ncbi:MAG: PASTA domain-containing protein [Thermoanaerobaculia bacterium]
MAGKIARAFGWLAYSGLLLILFAVVASGSFSLFVRSGVTKVPDLSGLEEGAVAARLADSGLELRRAEGAHYDERVPAGEALSQKPKAGSLVKRGSAVEVTISLGPQLVVVPDLTGQALSAAQVTLQAAGLGLGRTANVFADRGAPGTVVGQAPRAGDKVARSTSIDVFLSLQDLSELFLMPDLVYRDYEQVRRFFEARGFRLGSVKFEPYENVPAGVVLRQFPLPGHPLGRRDVISLVVASDSVES